MEEQHFNILMSGAPGLYLSPVVDYLQELRNEGDDSRAREPGELSRVDLHRHPEHVLFTINCPCWWCGRAPAFDYDTLFPNLGYPLSLVYPCCHQCGEQKGQQRPLQYLRGLVAGHYSATSLTEPSSSTPVSLFAAGAAKTEPPLAIFPDLRTAAAVCGYRGDIDDLCYRLDQGANRGELVPLVEPLTCCFALQSDFQMRKDIPDAVFLIWSLTHHHPTSYTAFRPVPGVLGENLMGQLNSLRRGCQGTDPPITTSELWGEMSEKEIDQECSLFAVEGAQFLPRYAEWRGRVRAQEAADYEARRPLSVIPPFVL